MQTGRRRFRRVTLMYCSLMLVLAMHVLSVETLGAVRAQDVAGQAEVGEPADPGVE